MKKLIIVIAAIALTGAVSARADTAPVQNSFYYIFHLYQNTSGQLVADRDFKFTYDVIPGVFAQSAVGQFPYRGEIIDLGGTVAGQFKFDVQPGKISVQAPYVADGQKAIFYDNQNRAVLTIPVSDSSYCNDDGICNSDRGETYQTCPNDCKATTLPAGSSTPASAASSGSSGLLAGIIYTVIGLGLIGGGWWLLKKREAGNMPTYTPPPQMPTPPAPPSSNNPV